MQKTIEEVIAEIDDALSENTKVQHDVSTDVSAAMTQHKIRAPLPPILDRTPAEKLPPYFTRTQLRQNRGWTSAEIDDFLGEPDLEKEVGYHTAKLYAKVRVLEVEGCREWFAVATRPPQVPLPPWDPERSQGYYRVRDLMDRGWYQADIKRFLGEPHRYSRNAEGWPVKLYKVAAVHKVETSEGFVYRPAAVAPTLFLQGLTLSKISEVLSLTQSEVRHYTKDVRKAVQHGQLERAPSKRHLRKQRKPRRQGRIETMTHLQKKSIVYFRMAGHSWEEVANLLNLPLNTVRNFARTPDFRELRQDAILCLDQWFGSEKNSDNNMET